MTADELRAWLKRLGISPAEAARRLPTHRSNLSHWLHGTHAIPPLLRRSMADLEREIAAERTNKAPDYA